MTPDQKYLFDLDGYLIVPDLLTPAEIALANEGIDAHLHEMKIRTESLSEDAPALTGRQGRGELAGLPGWEEPYGGLFRRMLTHPRLVPVLHEIIDKGFRLDHPMFMLAMEEGAEGFRFHGGAGPELNFNMFYLCRHGRLYSGLTVVAIQLTDVREGDGGFAVVPGSHKSNFHAPPALLRYEAYRDHVRQLVMPAGSAVVFTEAVLHGTLPWRSPRPRRTLLTRYTRSNMAYLPHEPPPAWATEREKLVMERPYNYWLGRPALEEGE